MSHKGDLLSFLKEGYKRVSDDHYEDCGGHVVHESYIDELVEAHLQRGMNEDLFQNFVDYIGLGES